MAQHIQIKTWEKELWYTEIVELIKLWVDKIKNVKGIPREDWKECKRLNHFIEELPDNFKWNRDDKIDDRVLSMRIYKDVELKQKYWQHKLDTDPEITNSNNIMLYTCDFEIHLDKDNKINEVYFPL